jgi:hypothetical protein
MALVLRSSSRKVSWPRSSITATPSGLRAAAAWKPVAEVVPNFFMAGARLIRKRGLRNPALPSTSSVSEALRSGPPRPVPRKLMEGL